MRVALVSLARRGGMVHFLAEIAGGLAPLAEVTAIVSTHAELTYLPAEVVRVNVETGSSRLGSLARLINPVTWLRFNGRLRALHADLVHITGVHAWNPIVVILCRRQGLPVVYTVHDPESHPGAPWTIRVGDWIASRLADKLVALTRLGRQQLLDRGEPQERVSMVPHPMYTLFRRWQPRTGRPEKLMLCFGRLEAYKGLDLLVQAFLSVRRSLPDWKLVVAGDGQLPEALVNASSADIEVINRYVPDPEVARLMSRCAIVALPYTSATQSGVIALALAFARPVVATAVGGLSEMVVHGKTGILVRPDDPVAFSRVLRSLASSPARRAHMQRQIRKIADARWGPQVVARAYLSVYSTALRARRSA
jgi:glycosyltransferase involved in cell wall biosynthesis